MISGAYMQGGQGSELGLFVFGSGSGSLCITQDGHGRTVGSSNLYPDTPCSIRLEFRAVYVNLVLVCMSEMHCFWEHCQAFLFRPREFSRALGCGASRYVATLGPGRAPWQVLWVFKVARARCSFLRVHFPPSESQAGGWKPTQKK